MSLSQNSSNNNDLKSAKRQKALRSKNARGARRSPERNETLKYKNI